MRYGYARVSSNSQDYNGQVDTLKAAGCERIFSEKMSGKSTNGRREFERLIKALVPGDTVVVTKLDRLARSSRDLHNILHELQEWLRLCFTWRELVRHYDRRREVSYDNHGRYCRVRAQPDPKAM